MKKTLRNILLLFIIILQIITICYWAVKKSNYNVDELNSFRIMEVLMENEISALLAVIMNGFSLLVVGMAIYVRFYVIVIFLFLAVLRLNQIIRRTNNLLRFELLTLVSIAVLLIDLKNSELIFILSTGRVLFFALDLMIRKNYIRMCCYQLTMFPTGIYYVIRKTNFLDIIFHPEGFLDINSAEKLVANGLMNIDSKRILSLGTVYLKWLCYQLLAPAMCL